MFIPIGDSPNPPGTAWVNITLISVNVIVFLMLMPLSGQQADLTDPIAIEYLRTLRHEQGLSPLQLRQYAASISEYDLVVFRHGFRPAEPSVLDIFTAMFLHGGWMHLLGNMLFLWIYGDNVEHRLGRLGYLAAYLGTGVAASLGDGLLRMDSGIPSVGASGAISGVLGLYFLWFPRNRVRVWVFLFPLFANVIHLPARLVLGFYLIFDNILPVLLTSGSGGVSHGAHIGGFAAGWLLALVLNRVIDRKPELRSRPPTSSTATSRQAGALDGVLQAERLETGDQPREALSAYQRSLAEHPMGPGRVRAHLGAARVLMGAFGNPTAAYQHLYSALEEAPTEDESAMIRAMLSELSHRVRKPNEGTSRDE